MRFSQLATFAAASAALALPTLSQVNYGVSVDDDYTFGDGDSGLSRMSDDGSFVVFESLASNLVDIDSNGTYDVFRRNLTSGETQIVSVRMNFMGAANGSSRHPDISASGRYIVWESTATNIVPGDTNGSSDIFLRDQQTLLVERLSVDTAGAQAAGDSEWPHITPNGRFVVFASEAQLVPADTNSVRDIYRVDRQTSSIDLVSASAAGAPASRPSSRSAISDDGRFVAFSTADDFSDPSGAPLYTEIFRKDMTTGELLRVSVSNSGAPVTGQSLFPSISSSGDTVAFTSRATNLVPSDTNDRWDVFARDIQAGTTERLSVLPSGAQATGDSFGRVGVSGDGRSVVFPSLAADLVPEDSNGFQDVFLRDRDAQTTARVSVSADGSELNAAGSEATLTSDAGLVAYSSAATNVLFGDTGGLRHVFARSLGGAVGTNFCSANANSTGVPGALTADGSTFAADNDLTVTASSLPPGAFGYFILSEAQGFVPQPGGSFGNLCIAGVIIRLVGPGQIKNAGTAGTISLTLDLPTIPSPTTLPLVQPGVTLNFQLWHRDTAFGTAISNFTEGISVRFN